MSDIVFPRVSGIISLDNLPGNLEIAENILDNVFHNLYYRNFRHFQSHDNTTSHSTLEIITARQIRLDVPGTGIALVVNPTYDGTFSSFPLQITFAWPIKKYVRKFNISNFAGNGLSFFNLLEELVDMTDFDFLYGVSRLMPGNDQFNDFAAHLNNNYGTGITIPVNTNDAVAANAIITAIGQASLDIREIVFDDFIIEGSLSETLSKLRKFYEPFAGSGDIIAHVKELLIPRISAKVTVGLGLEISRDYLKPARIINGEIVVEDDPNIKTIIEIVETDISFDSQNGIRINTEVSASYKAPYTLAQIGNTPVYFGFQSLKLDLSRKKNLPEVNADGRPNDFVGAYIAEATIVFPQFWNHDSTNSSAVVKGRNLIIGTGGFSGTLTLEALGPNGTALFRLGDASSSNKNFQLGLTQFLIEFKQNAIVQSEISGFMKIPGLKDAIGNDAVIDVKVHIGNNGDFRVTASEADGLQPIGIEDVFMITLRSVSIGRENDRWYIEASGSLQILVEIPHVETDFLKQPIDIKKLRIYQDGSIEFVGGGISLPTHVHINLGPVSLAMDHMGFHPHEGTYLNTKRQYFCITFDGSLNVGGGTVNVRGDGFEFHFTRDSLGPFHSYVRIAGIGVDIKIPGNASKEDADVFISGYLAMRHGVDAQGNEVRSGPEYQGSVEVHLNKLRIHAKASMIMRPKVPAYIVDVELEIPTPIPLGPTGLGIYGFRGLIGNHYVASKPYIGMAEDDSWYEYLKKKVPPRNKQGIGIEKFDPERKGFSLGVGATVATMGDNGWAFSSKVFVMISLPELLLIEGQANVLHKRLGIDSEDDPPFYAFLILDKNSVQAGIGVNYKLPDSGAILHLRGEMQMAFFFSNSTAWYINIGKDLPEDKRIQARLFTLFNAYAYLMISHKGIKAGAGAKFEMQKRFGPVRLGLYAFIDTKGFISFRPIQIGGAIVLGGGVYIRVSRFKIELHVSAGLSAEAPQPFVISGFVQIKIKIVFIKIKIKLEFTWRINPDLNTSEVRLLDPGEFHNLPQGAAQHPFKAINMLTGEAFMLKYLPNGLGGANPETDGTWNEFVIPMDSYIDVEFKRGVKPYTTRYGGGINPLPQFVEYVAPQKARMPQVKHSFYVDDIDIKIWNPTSNQWIDYDPWVALTRAFTNAGLSVNTSNFNIGYWQYNNVPGKYTSLRILSQSPFAVSNGVPPENFGILSQHILCQGQTELKGCQNWTQKSPYTIYPQGDIIRDGQLLLKFTGADGGIGTLPNNFGIAPSLKVKQRARVEIFFKEPMAHTQIRISALHGANVYLYKKVFPGTNTRSGLPHYEYEIVHEWHQQFQELWETFTYEDINNPVSKIMIEANDCDPLVTEQIFAEWWAALVEHWNHPSEPLDEGQAQQIQTWVNMWGQGGGNPGAIAMNYLCQQWETLLQRDDLMEVEINVLNQWTSDLCGNTDYEAVFITLCDMWQAILSMAEDYPVLYDYAFYWQQAYCGTIPGISHFDLCSLYVHQVCWLSEKQWEYNALLQQNNQSTITVGMNTLSQAINQALPPVWRPDSSYAIVIYLRDTLGVGGDGGPNYTSQFAFGFKTTSTLGFFHQDRPAYLSLLNYQDPVSGIRTDKSDQYKLANLRHYIDYERSYPNADGKILGAKPLYYKTPKLGLFFIKPYVYEFFTKWDAYGESPAKEYQLLSGIMDPVDQPGAAPAIPSEIIGWQLRMGAQAIPVNAVDIETISNILVQGNPNCTLVTNTLVPPTVNAEVQRNYDLKPQKLYNAIFKSIEVTTPANKESMVHSYTFETSRYGNFTEHILSYIRTMTDSETGLPVMSNAFFPVSIPGSTAQLAAMNTKLQQIINNTLPVTDQLIARFASVYDRIVSGVLEMQALQASTGTEFNIIKTINTQTSAVAIIGILVKSPEPFNDPKLPASEMAQTLTVTDVTNSSTQFNIVFAKDNSAIFVTNAAVSLPLHALNFTFRLRKFNGVTYSTTDTVNVPVDLATI